MAELHLTEQDTERFWAYVDKGGRNECWRWLGALWKVGHGAFRVGKQREGNRKMVAAHVVAFYLHNGYWPKDGEPVRQTCDHRWCCNPAHLVAGDTPPVACSRPNAIDPAKVFRLKETGARNEDIAARLGVTRQYVGLILRGKRRVNAQRATVV